MPDPQHLRVLRQHVETDRLLGVDAVPVRPVMPSSLSDAPAAAAPLPPVQPPAHAVAGAAPSAAARPSTRRPQPPSPAAPHESGQPASTPLQFASNRAEKIELLQAMNHNEVRSCRKCVLCESRTQTVFGEGDPDARLMFVGEGPGASEDVLGRPFVGRAGELLDRMITAMGLKREQVFIANVVKCRPPDNRVPQPAEILACQDYLRRQIAIIRPAVIVTLGGPATKTLLQTDTGITALRGTWHQYAGLGPQQPAIPVMPTFHPAYVLRNYTPETRGKVWSDLQKAMEVLGLRSSSPQ